MNLKFTFIEFTLKMITWRNDNLLIYYWIEVVLVMVTMMITRMGVQ